MKKLVLGIGGFFHDFNAALVNPDTAEVVAAEEERFSRIKHHPIMGATESSTQCINYCLERMQASPDDVCHVVFSDLHVHPVCASLKRLFPSAKFHQVHHHHCHAAAAYYCSDAEHAAVLTLDGWGDNCSGMLLEGRGSDLRTLVEIPQQDSVAMEYLRATHWLGLGTFGAEGKTQGLAPYGEPVYLDEYLNEIEFIENGAYRFSKRLRSMEGYLSGDHYMGYKHLYNDILNDLLPRRFPDEPLLDEHHNLAASVQKLLETVALHCASALKKSTQAETLVISGGAGLNSSMNAVLEQYGLFEHIYAHPSASDRGNALGAALYYVNNSLDMAFRLKQPIIYSGQCFDDKQISTALQQNDAIHFELIDDPASTAAELIADNAIIAWFQGKSELGARALGNRSILAHPGHAENKDKINARVKHREHFRPFAPSVLFDKADQWFDSNGRCYPFMTSTLPVKPECRERIPAVTHIDGTARLQTVTEENNSLYYRLINQFHQRTGIPVVLNTSFNDAGEPIVESPQDAIASFMRCDIDFLILGSYLVRKSRIS